MSEQRACVHCKREGQAPDLVPYYRGMGADGKPTHEWAHRKCEREARHAPPAMVRR